MTEHTPGPWRKRTKSGERRMVVAGENNELKFIARALVTNGPWGRGQTPEEEACANAHLIAAAPDLLEALDRVYHAVHAMDLVEIGSLTLDAACDAAEQALAKAKGQTP